MTKQLPQEIIDNIMREITARASRNDYGDIVVEVSYIQDILEKHLSLPKQEDLHTLLGKAFTILCNRDTRSEEDRLMRKQLEMRLENNSMNIDFSKDQEDTTPIEKIDKISDKLLNDIMQSSADEVIKRINNMK